MATRLTTLATIAAAATPALASCGYGTSIQPRPDQNVMVGKFGYIGTNGPIDWVTLDPAANILCGTGSHQSPVNLERGKFDVVPGSSINLQIPDMPAGGVFENLGTTVEVVADGGSMTLGGTDEFSFKQFHFHLPSEHLDNATSMAMEMHMVWEGPDSRLAVIGVFVDIDEMLGQAASDNLSTRGVAPRQAAQPPDSALLQTVFGSVSDIRQPGTATTTAPLIMSELVKMLTSGQFQTYQGSLTTPPCSEGVTWLVSDQKLIVTPRTYETARSVIGFNSRFPQNNLGEPNLLRIAAMRSIDS